MVPVEGKEPFKSAAQTLLRESGCIIRRYRSGTTGVAWTHDDDWGIEVPRPKGPVSFGTFAHEVGHQTLHRGTRRHGAAWIHEIEAWEFAIEAFDRFELPGSHRVVDDARKCMAYAAYKSIRSTKRRAAKRAEIEQRCGDLLDREKLQRILTARNLAESAESA